YVQEPFHPLIVHVDALPVPPLHDTFSPRSGGANDAFSSKQLAHTVFTPAMRAEQSSRHCVRLCSLHTSPMVGSVNIVSGHVETQRGSGEELLPHDTRTRPSARYLSMAARYHARVQDGSATS